MIKFIRRLIAGGKDMITNDPDKILNLLSDGKEYSSIEIHEATNLSTGRLYPALAILEQNKKIVSRWSYGPSPRKKFYKKAT